MSEITPFKFPEDGRDIRVLTIDGEPWFVASDVAGALGYVNPSQALATHVDDEDRTTIQNLEGAPGGPARALINESGLYALIFGSKLDTAKRFKRWVTADVLPAIRRAGGYAIEQTPPGDDLDVVQNMIDAIRADRRRLAAVEGRQDVVESQLAGVLGHYDEYIALGYAKLKGLDTGRSYLSRLGRMATKISRERGGEPRRRQDVSFGLVNVYPLDVLDEAAARLA